MHNQIFLSSTKRKSIFLLISEAFIVGIYTYSAKSLDCSRASLIFILQGHGKSQQCTLDSLQHKIGALHQWEPQSSQTMALAPASYFNMGLCSAMYKRGQPNTSHLTVMQEGLNNTRKKFFECYKHLQHYKLKKHLA